MNGAEQDYLDQMFREMRGKLLQYARLHLNGLTLAEDAVQEVFVIASLKIDAVMASSNPKGWLVNTLKNVIHEVKRSSAKQSQIRAVIYNDEMITASEQHDLSKEGGTRWAALFYSGLVSNEDYKIIELIELEGYSIHEAAQMLSIGDEACKKRIQRARARLKSAIDHLAG